MKTKQKAAETSLTIVSTVSEFDAWRDENVQIGKGSAKKNVALGFVPTMGALHEGHMTLIRKARQECEKLAVSIFVNPMQFGPREDFSKYPRTFDRDRDLCQEAGVDVIFSPSADIIYPGGVEEHTKVVPPEFLAGCLEGFFRPGFFTGVATVVNKLFNIIRPNAAYFGEKDFQQLQVIKRMVADFNMPVTIHGVPTVREPDGLALSSRNVYLNEEQRKLAPMLYKTLCDVRDSARGGATSLNEALYNARANLSSQPDVTLQYLEARDPNSFQPKQELEPPAVILVAAKIGDVRLIDNLIVS